MQVPRGLFLVTCTGTRAWTPASGPRTLLSVKAATSESPRQSPTLCMQPSLLLRQSSRGHGTGGHTQPLAPATRSSASKAGPASLLQPHSSALSLAQLSRVLAIHLAPLPTLSHRARPPTHSPSQPATFSPSLCPRKHLSLACCKPVSPGGNSAPQCVFLACGAALCIVSPPTALLLCCLPSEALWLTATLTL